MASKISSSNAGGTITAYIDTVSPYSFFAFLYLTRQRSLLATYDVQLDFVPFFLGGIMQGSGNKPPWTLPAKASYQRHEFPRAVKQFGVQGMKAPPFFPMMSILPQRALIYIKNTHGVEKYESTLEFLYRKVWTEQVDISQPELLSDCLGKYGYSDSEIKSVLDATKSEEIKGLLTANTKEALEKGAFGAPWMVVKNKEGKEEPFFGSDRWQQMWTFLGVEWTDVVIKPKEDSKL